MNKLKFDISSNLIMIDVYLWNKENKKFENMLITLDTGASNTVISKDILYLLGYEFSSREKARIVTASGIEYVDVLTLDKFKIGKYILEDVQIYAHTFPEASFSMGVLGLNILRYFDLSILFSTGELILRKLDED
jgi:predicted aspartyl protease